MAVSPVNAMLAEHEMGRGHVRTISEALPEAETGDSSPLEAPMADLTPSGRTALFTFRIGHPTAEVGLSPRRRLADVVES